MRRLRGDCAVFLARSLARSLPGLPSFLACSSCADALAIRISKQGDGSRVHLSICRDGSKQFLGILALERSIFFLVAKSFLKSWWFSSNWITRGSWWVRGWVGSLLACFLVCLHCFQEHGRVREKESSGRSLQKKTREKEASKD